GISGFGNATNLNQVTFDAHGDAFTDNTGAISSFAPFAGGGIVAYGAINTAMLPNPANHNVVLVTLTGSKFERNQNADVVTFGAQSVDHSTLPGTDNHVTVLLQGSSKKATVALPVPSDPSYPSGGNTAVVD